MAILYKYLEIFDENFFKKPTMKISVPEHFNDPFESRICNDVDEIIYSQLKKTYMMDEKKTKEYHAISKSYIEGKMSRNGVISLTRENSEILMWSHYAKNHTGMCIGLESNFATHKADETMFPEEIKMLMPTPVKYNKHRLNPEKEISIHKFTDDLYQATILNKYEGWEYEEEERIIIPIRHADKILIKPNNNPRRIELPKGTYLNFSISEWVPKIINDRLLIEIEEDEKLYYKKNEKDDSSLFPILAMYLGMFEETTFLMEIPTEKIKTVHFGCKTPESTISNMTAQLKDPKNNL